MFKGNLKIAAAAAILAAAFCAPALAQEACIVLSTSAQVEKEIVNNKGEKSKVLVPAGKVIPGTEVVWTVTANNVCKKPSDNVAINNDVPEHMTLVPNSAIGPGSEVTFSVDGKTYAVAGQVTVQENGAARPARADEYRHIRWTFKNSLAPGASANASYRATLD